MPTTTDDSELAKALKAFPAVPPRYPKLVQFGSSFQFAQRFTPANIGKCAISPTASVMSEDSPTLRDMDEGFSPAITTRWIMLFLVDLSEYSGCKGKITDHQLTRLAEAIHTRLYLCKASEVMLFFGFIEDGRYGKVAYGQFDPFLVLDMIPQFIADRNKIIDKELDIRKEKAEQERQRLVVKNRPIKKLTEIFKKVGNPLTPITDEEIEKEKQNI